MRGFIECPPLSLSIYIYIYIYGYFSLTSFPLKFLKIFLICWLEVFFFLNFAMLSYIYIYIYIYLVGIWFNHNKIIGNFWDECKAKTEGPFFFLMQTNRFSRSLFMQSIAFEINLVTDRSLYRVVTQWIDVYRRAAAAATDCIEL